MRTLLDTHAWIWWVTDDRRLSRRAHAAIAGALAEQDLWLALISIWELSKKVEKRQLVLDRPLDLWLDEALTVPGLGIWELVPFSSRAASCLSPSTAIRLTRCWWLRRGIMARSSSPRSSGFAAIHTCSPSGNDVQQPEQPEPT
jgi:PIN domain nuclease of toxin-antitoxin system